LRVVLIHPVETATSGVSSLRGTLLARYADRGVGVRGMHVGQVVRMRRARAVSVKLHGSWVNGGSAQYT
jgi:hypothetical protein